MEKTTNDILAEHWKEIKTLKSKVEKLDNQIKNIIKHLGA